LIGGQGPVRLPTERCLPNNLAGTGGQQCWVARISRSNGAGRRRRAVHLLYFWRGENYRRDLDHGVGFHLNQSNPLLHQIGIGKSLWAFTRKLDGRYALAAELVVSAKTLNPRGFRYGPYRVWGDLQRSRYFRVDGQPDIPHSSAASPWRPRPNGSAVPSKARRPSVCWANRITCDCSPMRNLCRLSPGLACSPRRDWRRCYWPVTKTLSLGFSRMNPLVLQMTPPLLDDAGRSARP
jgi:hypothetical protein